MLENRWFILAVLFLARAAIAFQFQTVGSLGPILVDALGIDYARLGTLIGLYMLPGVPMALPGGLMGQRFGAKRVVVIGLALMAAGGASMGIGGSFATLAAGRLASGVGAVLINVMLTKMVADWFVGREIVTAMSIFIASWPLGIGLALVAYAPLAEAHGWNAVMHFAAALSLLCLLSIAFAYRDPPGQRSSGPAKFDLNLSGREWRLVSLAGAIWGTYNVGYISLVSFAPEFFTTRGYSLAQASSIVSLIGWVLIPSMPISGYLAERWRRPDLFMMSGFIVVALATAMLPFVDSPVVLFALIALLIGLPPGIIMALPTQVLRRESLAPGMGVFYAWYYAAMGLLPGMAGWARDLTNDAAAPVLFAADMMVVAAGCLAAFRAAKRAPIRSRDSVGR
jgi:predicted MFS family arabinose efflux permease